MGKREAKVQEYLDSKGFIRKCSGYRYLIKAIEVAMEHPGMSCQDICDEISKRMPSEISSRSIYRNCTYSVTHSDCHAYSTYAFILEAADMLRRESI